MENPFQQFKSRGFARILPEADWLDGMPSRAALRHVATRPDILATMCRLLGPNISVRRGLTLPDSLLSAAMGPWETDPYAPNADAPMYSVAAIVCTEASTDENGEGRIALRAGEVVLVDRRISQALAAATSVDVGRGFYIEYAFRWLAPCPTQPPISLDDTPSDIERQLFVNHGYWNTFGPQAMDVPLVTWMHTAGVMQRYPGLLRFNPPATAPRYQV
ncbi:hypothetical protein ACKI2N_031905 [Cupriavidus sp. 30B13]|uniref:hypothetical protein n=1 Tax=Cupriavidus sp. 30B13 TaxID=3384241 RepID=UPI003B8F4292